MNRHRSDNPDRAYSRMVREEQLHRLETGPIICAFYLGRLWDGTLSPGYIPTVPPDNRPGVYVVESHKLAQLGLADTVVRSTVFGSIQEEMNWANENVRIVTIDHKGLPFDIILKDYVVYISTPLRNAVNGFLMPRKGLRTPYAAVPDGTNDDMRALLKMADPATRTLDAMRMGRARYGTTRSPVLGVPLQPGGFEFPSPGEIWK